MAKDNKGEKTEERIYTIPLRREWLKATRIKRVNSAVSTIKTFLTRHMHAADVKISQRLNERLWLSSIKKPPAKVKVKVKVDEKGIATARLPEELEIKKEEKKGKIEGLKERIKKGKEAKAEPEKEKSLGKDASTASRA